MPTVSDRRATAPDPAQALLVAALRDPARFGAACTHVDLVETHISYVLLTGAFAYKIKKAVRLDFLDFSTLEARRLCCEQEVRLNRRLAPSIYLDVVPITGSIAQPVIGGAGPILDYAVRMREFPQQALLGSVLDRQQLSSGHIDELAREVAKFHASVPSAAPESAFGDPDEVLRLALANFSEILASLHDPAERPGIEALDAWTRREHARRRDLLAARRAAGFIRECHGDLHLGNIALVEGAITIFDCIEFNEQMRWIDVLSEAAFTVMDLEDREQPALASRFLNGYLEITGDYEGVRLLPFYLVYRAMVRAKVACLRAAQMPAGAARAELRSDYRNYLQLAGNLARPRRPAIVVTHGLAGCGKTTISQELLERIGAIRVRTDVERKRLQGIPPAARTASAIEVGLYAPQSTRATYEHVLALAGRIVDAGFIALVDGTFLQRWKRDLFRTRAAQLHVPFAVASIRAREATLRERIAQRANLGSDASEADVAVVEHQLRTQEPLEADEQADVVALDGERKPADLPSTTAWQALLDRLGVAPTTLDNSTYGREAAAQDAKVAFLSRPASYSERATSVERIETHMSWVFLTDRHAFKMKKPVRAAFVDLRSLASRRRNCAEEVRLNRRLTTDVYLGMVALLVDASGHYSFSKGEEVADWLVRMRRLPRERMMDRLIARRSIGPREIDAVVRRLCDFYRDCPTIEMSAEEYRQGFAAGIAENRSELCRPECGLPTDVVVDVCTRQLAVLADRALFDERVRAGRVVEGHGDLRPEHVCAEAVPQIIDCLDFCRALRTLDTADEIAFLALECERLGAPELRDRLLHSYREHSGDAPPDAIVGFYQSFRACVRAKIAIWHLKEPGLASIGKWRSQANAYLALARRHIEHRR